ncbi:transposable element Tcb1 transposase [Trichonephila clavipes]|nr:transposable element Tcb1 transposase [Trichonephila clavipes]
MRLGMDEILRRSSAVGTEVYAARRRATKSICVVTTSPYTNSFKWPQLEKIPTVIHVQSSARCWSTCSVAGLVDRSECAVRNCWEQWTREGTHPRKTGYGATRKTTRREDRRIVRQALVHPTVTHSTIRADVGVAIVPQTISRHLAEGNLKSKRLFRAFPLTPEHRQLRTNDNRIRVWRRPGERYNSPHSVLRHTARTAGVMVWGAIAYDSRSNLIMMSGTLTGQRYVDCILRPHVGPFLNGLPGAIFQQDNARPHTARVAQDFLRHFQTLPWPARSPDLSPVEHVWNELKRQMPSCHSVHDLELAVQDL